MRQAVCCDRTAAMHSSAEFLSGHLQRVVCRFLVVLHLKTGIFAPFSSHATLTNHGKAAEEGLRCPVSFHPLHFRVSDGTENPETY